MSHADRHIDYVGFRAPDLAAVKKFYCAFQAAGLGGGFRKEETPLQSGTRVVIHFKDPSGNELGVWSDK